MITASEPALIGFWCALGLCLALAWLALRQRRRLAELEGQMARLRADAARQLQTDSLTELANRTALERWMAEAEAFAGTLAVCDLDNFKDFNDRYGHLVGDEVLRDVGQLIRTSIRQEDRAFRWGGDEFVICFHTQDRALVEERLRTIERRLANFHIRNHGPACLALSWGVATLEAGRPVRESLEEADRRMFEAKRHRRTGAAAEPSRLQA